MIRPLEMQAAFQAIPEMAYQVNQAHAAQTYRQVQDLGRARQENLRKPEQPQPAAAGEGAVFRPVENPGEAPQRRTEMREQARRRMEELRERGQVYTPGGMRRSPRPWLEDELGLVLDLAG